MSDYQFSQNPDYLVCLHGYHQLHALFLAGKSQSEEASAIRDRMESCWWNLPTIEQDRLDGLSEDLWDITATHHCFPIVNPIEPELTELDRNYVELSEAQDKGEWDHALVILRSIKGYLKPPRLAYWRGRIWQDAGDDDTAQLFLQYAATALKNYSLSENLDLLDIKFHFRSQSLLPTGTC
ncbi:MAG: hypothetical protein JWM11_7703 [Planctomycetaceae bacterium]|nr:hypothetical protein [Planctomycetaceae bacterium]